MPVGSKILPLLGLEPLSNGRGLQKKKRQRASPCHCAPGRPGSSDFGGCPLHSGITQGNEGASRTDAKQPALGGQGGHGPSSDLTSPELLLLLRRPRALGVLGKCVPRWRQGCQNLCCPEPCVVVPAPRGVQGFLDCLLEDPWLLTHPRASEGEAPRGRRGSGPAHLGRPGRHRRSSPGTPSNAFWEEKRQVARPCASVSPPLSGGSEWWHLEVRGSLPPPAAGRQCQALCELTSRSPALIITLSFPRRSPSSERPSDWPKVTQPSGARSKGEDPGLWNPAPAALPSPPSPLWQRAGA